MLQHTIKEDNIEEIIHLRQKKISATNQSHIILLYKVKLVNGLHTKKKPDTIKLSV